MLNVANENEGTREVSSLYGTKTHFKEGEME